MVPVTGESKEARGGKSDIIFSIKRVQINDYCSQSYICQKIGEYGRDEI